MMHDILGEELGRDRRPSDYLWIVDPIDGTTNYDRGIKHYGISIALAHRKKVVLGVVYNPVLGEIFSAERGRGAFLKDGPADPTGIEVSIVRDT
jgi:myo-inositol-1(or 4)-monophosphatase